jgi:hypothetical protein
MEASSAVLIALLLLLLLYGYRKLVKHHDYFSKRGIAFIKPTIFFGNMLEPFLELEHHEVVLKRLYNEFKREK